MNGVNFMPSCKYLAVSQESHFKVFFLDSWLVQLFEGDLRENCLNNYPDQWRASVTHKDNMSCCKYYNRQDKIAAVRRPEMHLFDLKGDVFKCLVLSDQ